MGFSRSVTQETAGTEFSEAGWSRTCTEDVCPTLKEQPTLFFSGISQPRWVELVLGVDARNTCTVLTDWAHVVRDLRQVISEATGVDVSNIELAMNKTGSTLSDVELLPSPVTVRGLDCFPRGSTLLGREQFVEVLHEIQTILLQEQIQGVIRPLVCGADARKYVTDLVVKQQMQMESESCVQTIFLGPNGVKASFANVAEMNRFFHSSNFYNDVQIQRIYIELNGMLGRPCPFLQLIGDDE